MLPVDSVVHQPPQCRALALGVVVSCGVAAAASVGARPRVGVRSSVSLALAGAWTSQAKQESSANVLPTKNQFILTIYLYLIRKTGSISDSDSE